MIAVTYSYNPALINDGGLNQMRFTLGDCLVVEADKTAYLSDEEINAAIEGSSTFKRAALRLVSSLLFRFGYEVNTEIHEAKWDLTDRFKNWKDLYNKLKAEVEVEDLNNSFGFANKHQRSPIFTVGLHDWGR